MNIIPEKACTGCGVLYACASENFYWVDKAKRLLARKCKRCVNLHTNGRRKQIRDAKTPSIHISQIKVKDYPETIACKVCGVEKPFTAEIFGYASTKTGQLYRSCKACRYPTKKAKVTVERAIRPERIRAYRAKYMQANRERIREQARVWKKAHPESTRADNHRRRARKLASASSHTRQDVLNQLESQKQKCYWCAEKIVGNQYHVDHIFALSKGGSNGPENICISCGPRNWLKASKEPHEFAGRLF